MYFSIALVCCLLAASRADSWAYPNWENDPDEPFPKWGGICDNGRFQSPINLLKKDALAGVFDALQKSNYDVPQKSLSVVNDGHSVKLSGFEQNLGLNGGPLLNEYVLEQVHFHWWSEHTIDDTRYPAEVHFVHRNRLYANMTAAAKNADGIAVMGVLYHMSNTPNEAIDSILEALPQIKEQKYVEQAQPLNDSILMLSLLPSKQEYFTYAGSLTTPGCSEAVTWIVFTESKPITAQQVNQFKQIQNHEGQPVSNNYRPRQPLHNRAVVLRLDAGAERSAALRQHLSSALLLPLAWGALRMLL